MSFIIIFIGKNNKVVFTYILNWINKQLQITWFYVKYLNYHLYIKLINWFTIWMAYFMNIYILWSNYQSYDKP